MVVWDSQGVMVALDATTPPEIGSVCKDTVKKGMPPVASAWGEACVTSHVNVTCRAGAPKLCRDPHRETRTRLDNEDKCHMFPAGMCLFLRMNLCQGRMLHEVRNMSDFFLKNSLARVLSCENMFSLLWVETGGFWRKNLRKYE